MYQNRQQQHRECNTQCHLNAHQRHRDYGFWAAQKEFPLQKILNMVYKEVYWYIRRLTRWNQVLEVIIRQLNRALFSAHDGHLKSLSESFHKAYFKVREIFWYGENYERWKHSRTAVYSEGCQSTPLIINLAWFFLVYFRNNFDYWLLAFSVMLLAWRCKRFRAIFWTQLIKSMKCITNLTINLGPCYCWSWDALNVTSERNGCFLIHDMIRIRDGHRDTEMSCENWIAQGIDDN